MRDTSGQGRLGEASAVKYFIENEYEVFHPMFGNTSCDLVVIKDGIIQRVEVKATRAIAPSGSYKVMLRSTRYNKTEQIGRVFDASKSEILAVYIVPLDKIVILNSRDYDGRMTVSIKTTRVGVTET